MYFGVTRLATRQTESASLTPFKFPLYGLHKVYPKAAEPLPFVFAPPPLCLQAIFAWVSTKTKARNFLQAFVLNLVGVTRFELATPRPPDVYSNRAELHPELFRKLHWGITVRFRTAKITIIFYFKTFCPKNCENNCHLSIFGLLPAILGRKKGGNFPSTPPTPRPSAAATPAGRSRPSSGE